jgi:esterase
MGMTGNGAMTVADVQPTEHEIRANGIRIHYLAWGGPRRPAVVLLHGGGQSAWTWQRVASRLAARYRLLAPDLRGHGDTEWSPAGAYAIDLFREDLHAFVRALGLDRFALAGMSMGGMAALAYAGTYGETLRGLVVIDIAPEIAQEGRDRIADFMGGRERFASLDEAVAYAHAFNPRRDLAQFRRTLPRNLRPTPDGGLAWKWDPAFFVAGQAERWLEPDRLWAAAARVPCPALVVHGTESDILTREAGERLAAALPHGRFVSIEGAGHSVQGDNPHSLGEALERFLSRLEP